MIKTLNRLLVILLFVTFTGCCGIIKLKVPINKPNLSVNSKFDNGNVKITIPWGGELDYEFINKGRVKGRLWFVYRLRIYHKGLLVQDTSSASPYNSLIPSPRPDYAIDITSSIPKPSSCSCGTALLDWKIIVSKNQPQWSNHPDIAAEVIRGTEVANISN